MIDTHCHINFDAYDEDRAEVIVRAAEAGVTTIINPAIDLESSRTLLTQADSFPAVLPAVGLHPNSSADFTHELITDLDALAADDRVIAIGEIGLDYYWDRSPRPQQFAAFEAQLDLAARHNLPVIIHNRDASEDVITVLESWADTLPVPLRARPGVLHSFSAPASVAERALAAGFYIGFTGPVTFKNADDLRRIAATVPLDRLLVETDGPFLTPSPHRGKRNEPAYIPFIVERLASLKQVTPDEMAQITTDNANTLFGLSSHS